jgi:zinc/manganese transport system substrate-binding protein
MIRLGLLALMLFAPMPLAKADAPIPVVATFSILGDLARTIGGERVAVETLVGANADPHTYAPKPTDAKKLATAKAVFVNGLGFERWLGRLIENTPNDRVIVASKGVSPLMLTVDVPDPHAWQSVANVRIYVANIREALIAADPAGRMAYEAQAARYLVQLDSLDRDIREVVSRIPESRRRAVTPHPSFGYFSAAYGLLFYAPQNSGNEAEASAKSVAALIDLIRRDRIKALFTEGANESRLIRRVAAETGVPVGGALYSDALTAPDGPAPTYIAMMRQNLRAIETALRE